MKLFKKGRKQDSEIIPKEAHLLLINNPSIRISAAFRLCDTLPVNNPQIKQIAGKREKQSLLEEIRQVLLHLFIFTAYLIVASNPS